MEELLNIEYIEVLIFLFFIYSFAGWFLESIGGILIVKKFVNRGFLIGPYCPVYGAGVVFITVLLNSYKSDFIVFYILSTLICGFVEYGTSYFMEKLFNARWWDYTNKKFNINGRVCLDNLLMFGIAASLIMYVFNPLIIKWIEMIPLRVRGGFAIVLSVLFILDLIFSFRIIANFKDEIDKSERDNTEEVSNMVMEKAGDMIMRAESNALELSREIKYVGIRVHRKVKYTGKKYTSSGIKLINLLADKAIQRKNDITKKIRSERDQFIIKTNTIRERFKIKSVLNKRLMDAFPKMQIHFRRMGKEENEKNGELVDKYDE